jgi:hypothetical protein
MHGHQSEALLRSLILIINARYGPMTTMAAQGLRHSLANLMEMTVQVSKCLACKSRKYTNESVALDKVANSTHPGYPMGGAEVCGTANNSSAAWVKVEKTGVVTFFNSQGDTSACRLDRGLKHGSRCTASGLGSSTKSSSTEPSSSLMTLKSSSSVSESSSTTFQTTPASNCSAAR